jgi:tryptophan-rich sensory protein
VPLLPHPCAPGDTWNSQFFLKQRPLTGLLTIGAFWATSVGSTALFAMTSPLAGALLAPTVAWVAVASSLNLDIWYLNRNKNK